MAEELKSRVYRQWDDGFVVRRMRQQDAQKVISWYSSICATSIDLQVVLDVCGDDVDGCYVGELNGEVVASTLELTVGDGLGYGSLVYVDERHRKSGLGRRIMDVARDVTENSSPATNIVAIDAHSELEEMYQRRGYKTAFAVTQFTGKVEPPIDSGKSSSAIQQVGKAELDKLINYDDKCYIRPVCEWRRQLMSRWIEIPGGQAVMAVSQQGDVLGYGCRRPAVGDADQHLIGPLYADSYDIARDLLYGLTSDVVGQNISMNICEPNEEGVRLVQELKLQESLHMIRMYRNGVPTPLSHRVFAITSIDVCGF